jgi:hypothetical protein
MYGTPMPVTFILLDTLEYNTIRVPTQFLSSTSTYLYANGIIRDPVTPHSC